MEFFKSVVRKLRVIEVEARSSRTVTLTTSFRIQLRRARRDQVFDVARPLVIFI